MERHARVTRKKGFEIVVSGVASRPWQDVNGPVLDLADGWYSLYAESEDGVCLLLNDEARHLRVEMSAAFGRPAHIRLQAGRYHTGLLTATRPGAVPPRVQLVPMSHAFRLSLLAGRTWQALKRGVSFTRFLQLARRALAGKSTFGLRAAGDQDAAGQLTRADAVHAWQPPADIDARLAKLTQGPRFLVRGGDPGAQVYGNWTSDPSSAHDWTVVCAADERLTPDALLLFAEATADPDVRVVIADRWEEGRATARVAFDPLLYAGGWPTPHAVRSDVSELASWPWARQQPHFASLGVPVAAVDHPALPRLTTWGELPASPASIIIPTRDKADMLAKCLDSLKMTPWPHEVIIVDNGSVEPGTHAVFDRVRADGGTVVRDDGPFNFSRLSNLGAHAASGEWLVFMNNDIELLDGNWLGSMVACAALPDVGAVGAKLLYADRSLQHGGVALGLTELCGHPWRHMPEEAQSAIDQLQHTSLRSAVTGALLCVAKARFDAVGGFDEAAFPVTLNDIDLCLRLRQRGWYSVFCASAVALHPEGTSRGEDTDPEKRARRKAELDAFAARWHGQMHDPWLSPSVSRASEAYNRR